MINIDKKFFMWIIVVEAILMTLAGFLSFIFFSVFSNVINPFFDGVLLYRVILASVLVIILPISIIIFYMFTRG